MRVNRGKRAQNGHDKINHIFAERIGMGGVTMYVQMASDQGFHTLCVFGTSASLKFPEVH